MKSSPSFMLMTFSLVSLFVCMVFPQAGMGTYAVITVDVCRTCGDDFQATWNGKDYGVPLIVEKLEAHGFKGTFFVSPECFPDQQEKMFSNLRFLVSRGHDVELHPHLNNISSVKVLMNQYTQEEKREILEKGMRILQEAGAPAPIAHRAGSLSIDEETLQLLTELGIQMDSSIYARWHDCPLQIPENLINRFVKIGGPYQLPIFIIGTIPFIGEIGTTALQLRTTIWRQQKIALQKVVDHKLPLVTIFVHYNDLFNYNLPDKPFQSLVPVGPNHANIDAFDNILNMLQTDTRFKVVTARELWNIHLKDPNAFDGPSFVPYTGLIPMWFKCWTLFYSTGALCKIVAVAPVVFVILAVLGLLWAIRTRNNKWE
jgi:peptidoglycan/xylan/chitin deacetylase (PgdA/CDA1 family)